MLSNGCTYGKAHSCKRHGEQERMEKYQRPGAQVRVTRYDGLLRKHAGYRAEPTDGLRAMLDALAHQSVSGERARVLRRRAGTLVKVA